jgi:hypothetical protein
LGGIGERKAFLQRVKVLAISEPFNGRDLFSLGFHCQDGARINVHTVHEHGAGTAAAVIAGSLGAGEIQPISENIVEGPVRIYFDRVNVAVDLQRDLMRFLGHHFSGRSL